MVHFLEFYSWKAQRFVKPTIIIILLIKMGNQQIQKQSNVQILNIPARLQWQNGHGFCGQTCVQSISLYFGGYISQKQVRNIAGSQFLVGENAQDTIDKLSFQYEEWNNNAPKPQYKNYLQWIKSHISQGHPVIVTGYEPQGNNDEYDHIYLAIGVKSNNLEQYSDDDQLIYADLFDKEYTRTPFGKIWDSRSMKGNGKSLEFAIPRDLNYGIAIKGIKDPEEMFLPVRLELKEIKQPNVSTGEQSSEFKYRVNVSELEEGKEYALLRYDTYKKIPVDKVIASEAANVIEFIAKESTYVIEDEVESSKMVYYRCVEAGDLS